METWTIIGIFFIAFLYSMVGHGGASGYLSLMALIGTAPIYMKSTALLLNVFVSAIAFVSFYKAGYFKWRILLPFVVTSIPMSFLGAKILIDPQIYKLILGVFLLIAILRLFYKPAESQEIRKPSFTIALIIGAVLGFVSGIIGIGGGIILSPLLLLKKWANVKETAAVSALFILLNSLSGISGLIYSGAIWPSEIFIWVVAGVTGGMAGSHMGSLQFSFHQLKYALAVVLLLASIKLIMV
jgi:uncharacterized protein